MYRQIVTPDSNKLTLYLPDEFIGHQVEVIAFSIDEDQHKNNKYSWENTIKDIFVFYCGNRYRSVYFVFTRQAGGKCYGNVFISWRFSYLCDVCVSWCYLFYQSEKVN